MAQKTKIFTAVTIATAGTRQQLTATSTAVLSVIVQADSLNTGKIYVGDSSVSSSSGIELAAGEAFVIEPQYFGDNEINLSDIYLDTATNNNVARIQYITVRGS